MCMTKACKEPTAEGLWWRDDAEWRQYDAAQAAIIQRAIKDGAKRADLGNLTSSKYTRGAGYVVDLTTMKQLNLATGYTRDVKIVVNAPAGNSTNSSDLVPRLIEEVRACQEIATPPHSSSSILVLLSYTVLEHLRRRHKAKLEMLPESVIQSLKQKVEKLEADVSAFKVSAANSAISKLRNTLYHIFGAGYSESICESCEPAGLYSPDFSSDDDWGT